MKLVIAGGSGFIGQEIVRHYRASARESENEMEIVILSRRVERSQRPMIDSSEKWPRVTWVHWQDVERTLDMLEGAQAFINLSGASINRRWSNRGKRAIEHSRVETTRRIGEIVSRLQRKPDVVINASAVGFYGTSWTDEFDESSAPSTRDFLADVVRKWEQESTKIEANRVVRLRIGVVLSNRGGVLPLMLLPYRMGIGGRIGLGKQWMSWIHVEDLVRIIDVCISDERIQGAVNATAPQPVQNEKFGRSLADAIGRPHWLPLPAFMLKIALGEMSMLLLEGQRVVPRKLLDIGFSFRYETIDEALQQLVGRQQVKRL